MKGKALLFKTIGVQVTENHSDFHRVPDDLMRSITENADRPLSNRMGQRRVGEIGRTRCPQFSVLVM